MLPSETNFISNSKKSYLVVSPNPIQNTIDGYVSEIVDEDKKTVLSVNHYLIHIDTQDLQKSTIINGFNNVNEFILEINVKCDTIDMKGYYHGYQQKSSLAFTLVTDIQSVARYNPFQGSVSLPINEVFIDGKNERITTEYYLYGYLDDDDSEKTWKEVFQENPPVLFFNFSSPPTETIIETKNGNIQFSFQNTVLVDQALQDQKLYSVVKFNRNQKYNYRAKVAMTGLFTNHQKNINNTSNLFSCFSKN